MNAHSGFILGACPVCGRRVARVFQARDGFKATCDQDQGGCGAESALGATAHAAAEEWRAGALRHSPMAEALTLAAERRRARLVRAAEGVS